MANPNRIGRKSYLYYMTDGIDTVPIGGAIDLGDTDAVILALNWEFLCVVDEATTRARSNTTLIDRCTSEDNDYIAGRRDIAKTINVNEKRLTDVIVKAWHVLSDLPDVFPLLTLNDLIAETSAWGDVGNFIASQDDDTQPAEGPNVQTLSVQPAALGGAEAAYGSYRRIYGSAIT